MKTARKCTPRRETRNGQPTGWWEIQKMVNGKRRKVRVKDGRQARAIANAWNEGREYEGFEEESASAAATGKAGGEVRLTGELIEEYLRSRASAKRVTSGHLANISSQLRQFTAEEGQPELSAISSRMLQKSINNMVSKDAAASTIDKRVTGVRGLLEWAALNGMIEEAPRLTVEKPKQAQGRLRVMKQEELEAIYTWLRGHRGQAIAAFIEALVLTGCRRNELLNRQLSDISDGLLILDKTKNGDLRAVPLSPRAEAILRENLPWPFSLSTLVRRVDACRKALGMEHWVLHSMRHTAATRLVAKGAHPAHIQKFLGHRTQAMTNRYTHLQAADIRGLAKLIDE